MTDKPDLGEQTGPQTAVAYTTWPTGGAPGTVYLQTTRPATYAAYRTIRRDPTVSLAREVLAAVLLTGGWSVEPAEGEEPPDEWLDLIKGDVLPLRDAVIERALYGSIDFGWQGWEKVYELDGNRVHLAKLKPLLHDLTTILVVKDTGAFAGFEQSRDSLVLGSEKSLLMSHHAEGTNWYGEAQLETIRGIYNQWNEANKVAARYDAKQAGIRMVVKYPPGSSMVDGVETSNAVLAQTLLKTLQTSGGLCVPTVHVDTGEGEIQEWQCWSFNTIGDTSPKQYSFIARLKYLDSLKLRGMFFPERALTEGQFGTKAEAVAHANWTLAIMEKLDRQYTQYVTHYVVDALLLLNFGEAARGKVRLVASPLEDEALGYLRLLYTAIVSQPAGGIEEYGRIDVDALRDRVQVPSRPEDEIEEPGAVRLPKAEEPAEGLEPEQFEGALTRGMG